MVSRREVLAGAGAMLVLGFDRRARAWSADSRCTSSADFKRLPELDGVVLTDPTSTSMYAKDVGNLVREVPAAVLLPGSVEDIQKMVRFCLGHDIQVAARGQGHTTFGQSQVRGGLIIDMASLNGVHSIGAGGANVGAGLKWSDLVAQTVTRGLRPPVLTGYLGLSVGGTLSVGGISVANRAGAQVDRVKEVDVVTGEGELVTCSASRNHELFEMALAGLGQCGIITRAKLDLVPALPKTRLYTIDYEDPADFFEDFQELLDRGELDGLYNFGLPNPAGGWIYQLTAAKHFSPGSPPDTAGLFGGLRAPLSTVIPLPGDLSFLQFAMRVDTVIDFFRSIGQWDNVLHPWSDVFVPGRAVESYVSDVVASLTPEDVGPTGFMLLIPVSRSALTRPLLRVPSGDEWVFLFDILTAAPGVGPDPAFEKRMLTRNRALFERVRRVGGTRYPIGSLAFSHADWVLHYKEQWPRLVRAKQRFDPGGILTPGPRIFA